MGKRATGATRSAANKKVKEAGAPEAQAAPMAALKTDSEPAESPEADAALSEDSAGWVRPRSTLVSARPRAFGGARGARACVGKHNNPRLVRG